MSWAGIGAIAGTIFRQYGAYRAGREAKKGTKNAMRRFEEAQAKTEKEQRPWVDFGLEGMDSYRSAITRYEKMMDQPTEKGFDYKKTPGYQFRLTEGLKSIGIADGNTQSYLSGAQMKAAQRYAQDYATGDRRGAYQDYLQGRQFDLGMLNNYTQTARSQLGIGQRAAEYMSNSYFGFGQQMGSSEMRLGDINAGVHLAQSEAAATGVENFFGSGQGSSGSGMFGSAGGGMGGQGGGGGGGNAQSAAGGMAALGGGGMSGGGGGMGMGF
ncbi:MAG: hypothetical protein ACC707_03040 [Thiohalomonadales bacterium]